MADKVEYHKIWRQKKKQSIEQLQETVLELSTELKRYSAFMNLTDQQLADLVQHIQPETVKEV